MSLEQVLNNGVDTAITRKHVQLVINGVECEYVDCELFRLQDGKQQAGYVLTSDAQGVGTWEAAVVGPQGPQGPQGVQGPVGAQGAQGPQGPTAVTTTTHTTAWNGLWSSGAPAAVVHLTKVQDKVIADFVQASATSDTKSVMGIDAALPADFRPAADNYYYVPLIDNNSFAATAGMMWVRSDGFIQIGMTDPITTWGGAGVCGIVGNIGVVWGGV